MKIIDKINNLPKNEIYYSFEYFPPKTNNGLQNLMIKASKMAKLMPLFVDITWGAGGSTSDLTLDICDKMQNIICTETQMHITCTNMKKETFVSALEMAKEKNIQNILALRGDPPKGTEIWNPADHEFSYAIDLIKFIKEKYGNYFHITVAGYPEGHPEGNNYQEDLKYLKEKVDAGADMIITQLFYDTTKFINFCNDCKNLGITCPILPGILPIFNYNSFKRMVGFCKVYVPPEILEEIDNIKKDDNLVLEFGKKIAIKMCKELINAGIKGLHFYTLNRDTCFNEILEELNLLDNISERKLLPWRNRINTQESIRPIFWSNMVDLYIKKTEKWGKYPNGRWGNSDDCAFGRISDYSSFTISLGTVKSKKKMWGENIQNIENVKDIFCKFLKGEIKYTPWCDNLDNETQDIILKLLQINSKGFLTINSQPRINGLSSNRKTGWGGKNGFLYQKEYLEFFTSKKNLDNILTNIKNNENISYCAVNNKGEVLENCGNETIILTWGVFPKGEIIQPTIAKKSIFLEWKKDAFSAWIEHWACIYQDEESFNFLKSIKDSYWLVFLIDHDYINGNIYNVFNRDK